jgi:hypothetical protein
MRDLSNFQRGQIVGVHLAVASVTTTATLLGVSRAAVSEVMLAYTYHGKTQSATRNSGHKPKLRQRDHCMLKGIVSKNYRITAAKVTAVFILKTMFPQKKSSKSFTNPLSTVELQFPIF